MQICKNILIPPCDTKASKQTHEKRSKAYHECMKIYGTFNGHGIILQMDIEIAFSTK